MSNISYASAVRSREFSKEAAIFISSDLYPSGEFMTHDEARLSVWDLGFTYGYSVYDVARAFNGKPWQLKEHIARFFRSCKACRLEIGLSREEVEQLCVEVCSHNERLLRKSEGEDFEVWVVATPGEYGEHGRVLPPPEGKGKPTFMVYNTMIDMKSLARSYKVGCDLVSPSVRHAPPIVMDPKIKTFNRLSYMFAVNEARLLGPECIPLMLDIDGNLAETHAANIFLVYEGVLMTPTTRNILEGVSRGNVISLAKQLNLPMLERDLQPFHLYNADEAFITGTGRCMTAVSRYNGVPIGKEVPGPITKRLIEAWSKWVDYDITGLSFLSAEERAKIAV